MSDITCIVFARNKRVTEDMIAVAKENNMVLMQTPCSVYRTSGELYKAGLNPVF
jgi:serine kinase of HPr protein (carbohydrate metabolism regulator)